MAMEQYAPLLAEVWREACRHIEIDEALARIHDLLRRRLPLEAIVVRRVDLGRTCVDTLALAGSLAPGLAVGRLDLTPSEVEEIALWCHGRRLQHGSVGNRLVSAKIAAGLSGVDLLLGPLSSQDGLLGAVVLVARPGQRFSREHSTLVRALIEPFTVALENDGRLRELSAKREAAEAERLSLLTRLGRREIPDAIVGEESGLRQTLERSRLVAPSDVPVLLLGETGSGKEVVAREIHRRSPRAHKPFLRVNCGAISPGLMDSELFGHERGSFTGASAERKGWFERSDGGTLFLDEIGELPLEVQVRLLRVLQDGTFERVGGQRTLHADVRVVAATHRDLHAMVADGGFRQDLWFRLAVFPIHLPPLRERPEDVAALSAHFAARAATRFGFPLCNPTPEDVDLLLGYPWPGNVRELITVMERAVLLGEGRSLEIAKALGANPAPAAARPSADGAKAARPMATSSGLQFLCLDDAMARHIEEALARTGGRIEGPDGAAHLLRINPHTLRARMRKLGVHWQRFRA
jgi:transcriptional regulator with GAF, ATPase, and Fis domain